MQLCEDIQLQVTSRNRTRIPVVAVVAFVALTAIGFATYSYIESKRRTARDERIVQEVEAEVESFLRAGGANADPATFVDQYHDETAKSLPKVIGQFVRIDGTGFLYPVWGVTLDPYLDLRRTAVFTHCSIPMRIIVTRGHRGSKVGNLEVRGQLVYVSHPDLID
jgi:hypothetical protein